MRTSLFRRFLREEHGAVLVEATIVMFVLVLMVAAFVELSLVVSQWNLAVKSVQLGSRLASVSDPVDSSLAGLDPVDPFTARTCTITNIRDNGMDSGTCTGGVYDGDAMQRIIFGTDTTCSSTSIAYHGMCDIFPSIVTGTVEVTYAHAGLGYPDRPAGPVPVIRVTIRDVTWDLPLLSGLLRTAGVAMPAFSASAVSEDMSATFAAGTI